jgi:hypothetical protein
MRTDNCFRGTAIANLQWGRSPNFMAALLTSGLHYLSGLPTQATRRVKVQWRRGHPERRMDTEQYEMHDHMNVACDALAPAVPHHRSAVDCQCEHNNTAPTHLHSCVLHKLPGQPIRACYMGKPIVSRMAHTVMRYAQAVQAGGGGRAPTLTGARMTSGMRVCAAHHEGQQT